jgi:hypothetical protein
MFFMLLVGDIDNNSALTWHKIDIRMRLRIGENARGFPRIFPDSCRIRISNFMSLYDPRALLINCQILSKLILFILILTVLVTIIEVPLKVKVKYRHWSSGPRPVILVRTNTFFSFYWELHLYIKIISRIWSEDWWSKYIQKYITILTMKWQLNILLNAWYNNL